MPGPQRTDTDENDRWEWPPRIVPLLRFQLACWICDRSSAGVRFGCGQVLWYSEISIGLGSAWPLLQHGAVVIVFGLQVCPYLCNLVGGHPVAAHHHAGNGPGM